MSYRSRYSGDTPLANGAWIHSYKSTVEHKVSTPIVYVTRANGSIYLFEQSPGASAWTSIETADTLSQSSSGWQLKLFESDTLENYDTSGKLLSVQQRNGLTTTLSYNAQNQLATVTHPYGRNLSFEYNGTGQLTGIITSAGERFALVYDANGNLSSLTRPDGLSRRFHYEDTTHKNALTGITVEGGQRIGTYSYDSDGYVTETQRAKGVGRVKFTYGSDAQNVPQTMVTRYNAAGESRHSFYNFVVQGRVLHCGAQSDTVPGANPPKIQYDSHSHKTREITNNGEISFYTYDDRGRQTQKATYPANHLAATNPPPLSAASEVSTTQWHATWNLPLQSSESNTLTRYNYDAVGNLLELIEIPTADATGASGFSAAPSGKVKSTIWTYNDNNLPATIAEQVNGKQTGHWAMRYNAQGDMTEIVHSARSKKRGKVVVTRATLTPQKNGSSQVTEITRD